jgi:malate dehydrogenase (oxaloacetate-decarboxylating)
MDVGGKQVPVTQTDNSYIFPGLALGIVASKATRVTDVMVKAAAQELVRNLPTQRDKQASLLPPLSQARKLSRLIGRTTGDLRWPGTGCKRRCLEPRRIFGNQFYVPYERK